jgi:hypothetical protein
MPYIDGTSPKASITSPLLADVLKYLDCLGMYNQKQEECLKAILKRGWNPINYNILITPPHLANDTVALKADVKSQAVDTVDIIQPFLNLNIGREIKSKQKIKGKKIEHLKKLTEVSSVPLTVKKPYTTHDTTVLEMTPRKEIQERKGAADLKCIETLK